MELKNKIIEEIQEKINLSQEYNDKINEKEIQMTKDSKKQIASEKNNIFILVAITCIIVFLVFSIKLYNNFSYILMSVLFVVIIIKVSYLRDKINSYKSISLGRKISQDKRESKLQAQNDILKLVKNIQLEENEYEKNN